MQPYRRHETVSADGTPVVARVQGQGPPLVLVHGAFEDGDSCWEGLLPFLVDRFTCFAVHLRGRGPSGWSPDLSTDRLVEDVVAVVDSVGEPVELLGESGGGRLVLGVAARSRAVAAVAAYEPVVLERLRGSDAVAFEDTIARAGAAAAAGRPAEAVEAFATWLGNDDELTALSGAPETMRPLVANVPVQVQEFAQLSRSAGGGPTDGDSLATITAPVLLLHGARTARRAWFTDGITHVVEHVADARVREVPGAGHFGVALAPGAVADGLTGFLGHRTRVA